MEANFRYNTRHMSTETRVNIGPMAKQIKTDGPTMATTHTDLKSLKPEFQAVSAVLIDKIIADSYEERNLGLQSALILNFGRENTFETLEKVMMQDIGGTVIRLGNRLDSNADSPEYQATYNRFKQLLETRAELDPEIVFLPSLSSLYGGLQTATFFMSESLRLIHALGDGKSPEELLAIARRSYSLIVNTASMHLEHFIHTGTVIHPEKDETDQSRFGDLALSKFALIGEPGSERLGLSPEATLEIQRLIDEAGKLETPTTGCPALVNFGGGSAIKKLWDWHLELAERIYPALANPDKRPFTNSASDPTWGVI